MLSRYSKFPMHVRFCIATCLLLLGGGIEVQAVDDNRMVAYVGNWQTCPTIEQVAQYTHIVIGFAVSYTWGPSKNECSPTCDIAMPTICDNTVNTTLVQDMHNASKKALISFGGGGMGGSWKGNANDCWLDCFGKENEIVDRLVEIVQELGLDGVDINYNYYFENGQNGANFSQAEDAIHFLTQVTLGLREKLPKGSLVTHTAKDNDLIEGNAFFGMLQNVSDAIDFLMPQYYNGNTRPVLDGFGNSGVGNISTLEHYQAIVNGIFAGDPTRVVLGLCIQDCLDNSGADKEKAPIVVEELQSVYPCHGGVFFWIALDDQDGAWSSAVNQVMEPNSGCSSNPLPELGSAPTRSPSSYPTLSPTQTASPSISPVHTSSASSFVNIEKLMVCAATVGPFLFAP